MKIFSNFFINILFVLVDKGSGFCIHFFLLFTCGCLSVSFILIDHNKCNPLQLTSIKDYSGYQKLYSTIKLLYRDKNQKWISPKSGYPAHPNAKKNNLSFFCKKIAGTHTFPKCTFESFKNCNMKFPSPVPVKWLASLINAELAGDENLEATGINEIHSVEKGDVVFVDHPKYYNKCLNSAASIIIINKKTEVPGGKTLLVTPEPFEAYTAIVKHFNAFVPATQMISDTAVIGKDTVIMPNVFIGNKVNIGSGCILHPNVVVYDNCTIGNNVIIHSGTVVGSDAFYFNTKKNREVWFKKMQSCGRVIIEDDVELGACCTIDRGVSADTKIGKGSKLDNQVHLAHEVVLGKNCLIAAQVAIAGATVLGDGVTLWGQVGVSKTLKLGDNVTVLAQSGLGEDIEDGKIYFGTPAGPALQKQKELVWIKRIPEIWEKVKDLTGNT